MNTNIYIDKKNKQKLIHSIQTHDETLVDVVLFKKKSKIHSLLINFLPSVLIDIINEYNYNVIHVTCQLFCANNSFTLSICNEHTSLFEGNLYIKFNPMRWFLAISRNFSLYFDGSLQSVDFTECLFIFNKFMSHYYGIPKYIDDGLWQIADYPKYEFSNDYLIHNRPYPNNQLKNKKLFKKIIVIIKIIVDVITTHYTKKIDSVNILDFNNKQHFI